MTSTKQASILVVGGEPQVRRVLEVSLRAHGFIVDEASTAAAAIQTIRDNPYDLALLDISGSTVNGFDVCRQIRIMGRRVGVVMITVRSAVKDIVQVLEAGADDYITKPFDVNELAARCHAIVRRIIAKTEIGESSVHAGDLELDLNCHLIRRAGKTVHLTPKEFNLLALLMRNQGVLLTHARLLRSVWGPEYHNELEYLHTYVRLLRKKIEDDPAQPRYLVTERGLGYRFCCPKQHDSKSAGLCSSDDPDRSTLK